MAKRHLLVCVPLLMSCVPAFAQDDLAARAAEQLRQALAGFEVRIVDPQTVLVKGPDGQTSQVNLDRMAAFCAANRDECDQVFANYLERVTAMVKAGGTPPLADSLRAVVRGTDFLEQMDRQLAGTGTQKIVGEHLAGGLTMACEFDLPTSLRAATSADLERLGLSEDAALALCKANTLKILTPLAGQLVAPATHEVGILATDQGYTASHFLFPDDWSGLAGQLGGHLLVSVPADNVILFVRDDGPEAIAALSSLTQRAFRTEEQPVSPRVFRWSQDGWQPVPQ